MKRLLLYLYVAMLITLISGCSNESIEAKDGTYMLQTADDIDAFKPRITITGDKIDFMFDFLSSYASIGTYEVDGNVLTMVTDDDKYTYKFRVDDGALFFVEDESSVINLIDEKVGYKVADKAEFLLVEE